MGHNNHGAAREVWTDKSLTFMSRYSGKIFSPVLFTNACSVTENILKPCSFSNLTVLLKQQGQISLDLFTLVFQVVD